MNQKMNWKKKLKTENIPAKLKTLDTCVKTRQFLSKESSDDPQNP